MYCHAEFNTDSQNNAATAVSCNQAWIGFNDLDSEGTYVWTDDTSFTHSNCILLDSL